MESENTQRYKEFIKRLDEIERREIELRRNYSENRESLYNENIDLIKDALNSLGFKELKSLLKKMKYEL